MIQFDALTAALEDWFDTPLCDLPDAIRQRVEQEFFPMPWDKLSADQRRSVAVQMDYQHDPATEQEQKIWWDFFQRVEELKRQVADWESVATPTAADLATKETRLAELKQELSRMEAQQRFARGDYFPQKVSVPSVQDKSDTRRTSATGYVAYPKAMQQLASRLGASPEELAAWIWAGPEHGGIAAYVNANELRPPRRFSYLYFIGTPDYIAPLMACWFKVDDVEQFEPADRFIVGTALIERWKKRPGLQASAFIHAKIAESRLVDIHPIYGGTRGTFSENPDWPFLESGLFALGQVERIEFEDFFEVDSTESQDKPPDRELRQFISTHTLATAHESVSKKNQGSTVRREARKLETQALYKEWQKAYRVAKKTRPNMSDVWYSEHIAKMPIAKGRSADTVRKHMKP